MSGFSDTPSTEAGRALLKTEMDERLALAPWASRRHVAAILAIEAQARAPLQAENERLRAALKDVANWRCDWPRHGAIARAALQEPTDER
jgi:hypothetical protein